MLLCCIFTYLYLATVSLARNLAFIAHMAAFTVSLHVLCDMWTTLYFTKTTTFTVLQCVDVVYISELFFC